MQVRPIKPVLKPPRPVLFKLRCDGSLSDAAFKFNLRRHTKVEHVVTSRGAPAAPYSAHPPCEIKAGQCSLTVINQVFEAPTSMVSALEATISSFAFKLYYFNFNLRRYIMEVLTDVSMDPKVTAGGRRVLEQKTGKAGRKAGAYTRPLLRST